MIAPGELDPALYTRLDIERPSQALIESARRFDAATLHEAAGKRGALPAQIAAVTSGLAVCGPAVTVQSPGGDNLWLHRAIYAAQPGDVLVVSCGDQHDYGYWGEIMATAARVRGIRGLVIDGCVRDRSLLEQIGLPIFARGVCIRVTGKDFGARGWINHPILVGDVVVQAGDLIVGDADGVVCVPRLQIEAVIAASARRQEDEAKIVRALEGGASTLDLYGWSRQAD